MWYKLDGDDLVKVDNAFTNENDKRHNVTLVFITLNKGDEAAEETLVCFRISTTFLGLDHGYNEDKSPIVFETMIFKDHCDIELDPEEFLGNEDIQIRYHTIQGARKGHRKLVDHVKDELAKKALGEVEIADIIISL